MTQQQQQSIIAKESAWIDADQFAPLDLSAFPALQPPSAPEVHDDRWSKDWRDTPLTGSANALRSFVFDPDTESLERGALKVLDTADIVREAMLRQSEGTRPTNEEAEETQDA